jgi:hypothetical protein
MEQHRRMRIRALSVFERIVYHCACLDSQDPSHPVLEVDAVLRDGDADGPLLVTVADYKRMIGFDAANACLPKLRASGRTEVHDGVEYLTFPLWSAADTGP